MTSQFSLPFRHPLIAVGSVVPAVITGAIVIEAMGYPPCTLCLYQRVPYYVMTAALVGCFAARRQEWFEVRRRYVLLAFLAVLVVSMGLGMFHAGVEFALWEGPKGCSGTVDTTNMENLLETLRQTKVVSCTKASFWIFGLSLSVWNVVISAGLAVLVANGVFRTPSRKAVP
jgi:disulfide bond formation protein DsbB